MQKLSRAALAILLAMSATGLAAAGTPPATGLGQAWPNATDVSANPNWHVYVFELNGVKYVQVNDLNGNVLGAIGTVGGQFITLPMGRFAQYVSTPQEAAASTSGVNQAGSAVTVYKDSAVTVTATPASDGTTSLTAATPALCEPPDCQAHGG